MAVDWHNVSLGFQYHSSGKHIIVVYKLGSKIYVSSPSTHGLSQGDLNVHRTYL